MARNSLWCIISAAGLATTLSTPALAQISCGTTGPDALIGRIDAPSNYAHVGDVDAFSATLDTCNVGSGVMTVSTAVELVTVPALLATVTL